MSDHEVGRLAEFVVLDDDLLTCDEDRLRSIRPELTVIGGQVVFDAKQGVSVPKVLLPLR